MTAGAATDFFFPPNYEVYENKWSWELRPDLAKKYDGSVE